MIAGLLVLAALAGCGAQAHPRAAPSPSKGTSTAEAAGAAGIGGLAGASPTGPAPSASPSRAGTGACPTFPADNVWHADVSRLAAHPSSGAWIASIGAGRNAHPDFGSGLIDGAPFGIPVTVVPPGQPAAKVSFDYAAESDRGPYPIPRSARVEGGPAARGDRHVILHDAATCKLYELFAARPNADGSWRAGSGAVFDLRSNALRPAGWTSADAAGLPIYAGLVRYDEVAAGRIEHAIRFTAPTTRGAYVWPARHAASAATSAGLPPMGARFRLRAGVDISRFPAQARVIAEALRRYGAILADNGSSWFFSGTQDDRWNNDALNALKTLKGSDFEAVDTDPLMVSANSGAVRL